MSEPDHLFGKLKNTWPLHASNYFAGAGFKGKRKKRTWIKIITSQAATLLNFRASSISKGILII
jgi:hypothetical protein